MLIILTFMYGMDQKKFKQMSILHFKHIVWTTDLEHRPAVLCVLFLKNFIIRWFAGSNMIEFTFAICSTFVWRRGASQKIRNRFEMCRFWRLISWNTIISSFYHKFQALKIAASTSHVYIRQYIILLRMLILYLLIFLFTKSVHPINLL